MAGGVVVVVMLSMAKFLSTREQYLWKKLLLAINLKFKGGIHTMKSLMNV